MNHDSRSSRLAAALLLASVSACSAPGTGSSEAIDDSAVMAGDHHVHIQSASGAAILSELERLLGAPSGEPPTERTRVTAADVIAALDNAGVEAGVVLSLAYMFGVPDTEVEDEYAMVRAENDFVAEQVARYPDRLVGACSVNPLAEYALEEIQRCGADDRLGALKLHLANSDVDLFDPQHVERLAAVFGLLARLEMPAVVHVRNRNPAYGAEDARIFIDEVLSRAPNVPIQIAHMGGWGGYDDGTDAALATFAGALADGRLDPDLYTFDLGAVVFEPAAAGADTALARSVTEANLRLADRIREIGIDRVVYATDWPAWPPVPDTRVGVARNIELVWSALPLTDEEKARILSNAGPILRGR